MYSETKNERCKSKWLSSHHWKTNFTLYDVVHLATWEIQLDVPNYVLDLPNRYH